MPLNIRPMTLADKTAVVHILRNTPEFTQVDIKVAEELIDCYLQDPFSSGYHTYIVDEDTTVAGYVCFGPAPLTESTWDIYWIAIAPDRQGRGTGRAFLAFTEGKIKEAGGRLIIIETSSTPIYEKTVRFYLNHGYTIIGRIPDFYAPGDDKLILQKRLGPPI